MVIKKFAANPRLSVPYLRNNVKVKNNGNVLSQMTHIELSLRNNSGVWKQKIQRR